MSEHSKQDSESVQSPADTDIPTSPEPASSPDKNDQEEDESPLPQDEPKQPLQEKKQFPKSKDDDMFIADNSHLLVEEKLEKMREAEEAVELKKIRTRRKEKQMDEKQALEGKTEEDELEEIIRKRKAPKLVLCTQNTRYRVVKKSCRMQDFKLNEDENCDWDIYWADTGMQQSKLQKMQSYQRVNHYPGMAALGHKNNLARNLKRMSKFFEREFDFSPKTWILPQDANDFKNQFTKKKAKTFIVKPVAACQGRGIYLTRDWENIDMKPGEQCIVQRYMHKPYLIDNLKFDMRIYCLVYGVDPLRVFVFREGLARFATEEYLGPYRNNLDNLYMHLTNYAINKNSEAFEANEDSAEDDCGHKRSVSSIFKYIEENEPESGLTAKKLWDQIDDIAVKTLISAQPQLCHSYRSLQPDDVENSMCFEVLGLDIFLDDKLKPWLIEVNSLPSFATDSPLDKKIKFDMMFETIAMLNLNPKRKRKLKREKTEQFNRRQYKDPAMTKPQRDLVRKRLQAERDKFDQKICTGYVRVYPSPDPEKQELYQFMMDQSKYLFNEFTSGIPSRYPATSGFVRADPRNMSKTNPLPKGKAADLQQQPVPIPQSPNKGSSQQIIQGKPGIKSSGYGQESPNGKIQRTFPNPNNPYGPLRFQNSLNQARQEQNMNPQYHMATDTNNMMNGVAVPAQLYQGMRGVYNLTYDEPPQNQQQYYFNVAQRGQSQSLPQNAQRISTNSNSEQSKKQNYYLVQSQAQSALTTQVGGDSSTKSQNRFMNQLGSNDYQVSKMRQDSMTKNQQMQVQLSNRQNSQQFGNGNRQNQMAMLNSLNGLSNMISQSQLDTAQQNQMNYQLNQKLVQQNKNNEMLQASPQIIKDLIHQSNNSRSEQKSQSHNQQQLQHVGQNFIHQAPPPKVECIAKSLQKQFPLIRLEQSLLVNGCMNSCPVHGLNRQGGNSSHGKVHSAQKPSQQSSIAKYKKQSSKNDSQGNAMHNHMIKLTQGSSGASSLLNQQQMQSLQQYQHLQSPGITSNKMRAQMAHQQLINHQQPQYVLSQSQGNSQTIPSSQSQNASHSNTITFAQQQQALLQQPLTNTQNQNSQNNLNPNQQVQLQIMHQRAMQQKQKQLQSRAQSNKNLHPSQQSQQTYPPQNLKVQFMNSAAPSQGQQNQLMQMVQKQTPPVSQQMQYVQQSANNGNTTKTYIIHNQNGKEVPQDKNFHQKVLQNLEKLAGSLPNNGQPASQAHLALSQQQTTATSQPQPSAASPLKQQAKPSTPRKLQTETGQAAANGTASVPTTQNITTNIITINMNS